MLGLEALDLQFDKKKLNLIGESKPNLLGVTYQH